MKTLKTIINIIIGSIAAYLSILFLAVGIDSTLLVVMGLFIAPAIIIYINKKFTVKPSKYYLSLFGAMVLTIVIAGMNMDSNVDTANNNDHQKELIANIEESVADEVSIDENIDKENTEISNVELSKINSNNIEDIFKGYKLIEVYGGDLSGHRQANVVVDIGFGDREYWAFTNEYGQLVKVIAKEIILQDESREPVTSNGRYYPDEAKVPGVESKNLDEGHVIADSLGGVSNAYNITPQNSTLNRHGDQAYMEKVIRDAGGCTDFVAIISYPNKKTQIPSHYSYTYTIRGNVIKDEFDNINPDKYNSSSNSNKPTNNSSNTTSKPNNTTNNTSKPSSTTNNSNTNNNSRPSSTVNNDSKNENQSNNSSGTVYWTPSGKSYHTTKNCTTLSRSKNILQGSISSSGKHDPCNVCH